MTEQTRAMRKSYPTDLTAEQWELLETLIPQAKIGGRPRSVDIREVVNGILYVLGHCQVNFRQV